MHAENAAENYNELIAMSGKPDGTREAGLGKNNFTPK